YLSISLALFACYFITGTLGLRLAYLNPSATPVWPPSGIALAALLLLGSRLWPAIFLGAFCVNLPITHSVLASLAIAGGNTLEGLLGAHLVQRSQQEPDLTMGSLPIARMALLAAVISTTTSASIGVAALAFSNLANWANFSSIWLTWWLGDAV